MTDADKRDRIIAAAYQVLSEKGYDKASTKEIASTAGVAQGLINYYFPSKDLLFAEVFRRETQKYCEAFRSLMPAEPPSQLTRASIGELLEIPKSRATMEPDWFRLRYELFAIGLRNENAADTLKETLEIKRQNIADTIEKLSGFPREQSVTVASVLYAMIEGLGLQKVADPDFKYDEAYGLMADMLSAYYNSVVMKERP